jgi:hypothetical protein
MSGQSLQFDNVKDAKMLKEMLPDMTKAMNG